MKTTIEDIQENTMHRAGRFEVSVGMTKTEVAIFSLGTGDFITIGNLRKGSKATKAKRKFKTWLNSDTTLTFSGMQPETTVELINFLK